MSFTSLVFLLAYLPVVLGLYLVTPRGLRNGLLLVASLLFYAWGEPRVIGVMLASAAFDWFATRAMHRSSSPRARKAWLSLVVIANLAVLVYYKYFTFSLAAASAAMSHLQLGLSLPVWEVALPIGVSFIVFEKITYVVDVYRGIGEPVRTLPVYLLYVFLFPKLIAGPIIKYHDIAGQIFARQSTLDDTAAGLARFSAGLAKKVFLADTVARVADQVFKLPPEQLGAYSAWLGLACFSMQIYFDFSGYSDMAIGLARVLGFHLRENFNSPYISQTFTEFWRRWHISLSTWIRDYLYIPLGGSRVSQPRMYFNLWVCFLLSGLWHGASWTFVLWGAYHGLFLVLDKMFWLRLHAALPKAVNIAITFALVSLGWVLFRATDLAQLVGFLRAMFGLAPGPGTFLYVTDDVVFCLALGLFLSFAPAAPGYARLVNWYERLPRRRELELLLTLLVFVLAVGRIAATNFNPFLYFRF